MPTELLFSYGTLQKREIQIAQFGRELTGWPDAVPGYTSRILTVDDPAIASLVGETETPNAEPSSNPEDALTGVVFEITAEELAAADQYESAAHYRRASVTLRSGTQAWIYVHT